MRVCKSIIALTMIISLVGLFVVVFQFSTGLGFTFLFLFSILNVGWITEYEENDEFKK